MLPTRIRFVQTAIAAVLTLCGSCARQHLEGVVLDEHGASIESCKVVLESSTKDVAPQVRHTDRTGKFYFANASAPIGCTLRFVKEGYEIRRVSCSSGAINVELNSVSRVLGHPRLELRVETETTTCSSTVLRVTIRNAGVGIVVVPRMSLNEWPKGRFGLSMSLTDAKGTRYVPILFSDEPASDPDPSEFRYFDTGEIVGLAIDLNQWFGIDLKPGTYSFKARVTANTRLDLAKWGLMEGVVKAVGDVYASSIYDVESNDVMMNVEIPEC